MNKIFAFIVGIEKYARGGIGGPSIPCCANALAIIKWLVSIGVPAHHISAFLSPIDPLNDEILDQNQNKVAINNLANFTIINQFWRNQLKQGKPAHSQLLVYWSGHGITDVTGDRIFFFADYSYDLNNLVFNGTRFLRFLQSPDYNCFSETIFLADVCGNYNSYNIPFALDNSFPQKISGRPPLAVFATPEGDYAYGEGGLGKFTRIVLEVLGKFASWPDKDKFKELICEAFHGKNYPFIVDIDAHSGRCTISRRKAEGSTLKTEIENLPDTPYKKLVGREDELAQFSHAWSNDKIKIVSLIASGGMGKTAIVNEWLVGLQTENYLDAQRVLGWSFHSQGITGRSTSADDFLKWALDKLGVETISTQSIAYSEALADKLTQQRILLILDGIEALQHGPDPDQEGQLIDSGLRSLLRRFATSSPTKNSGLIVITSRLAVRDIDKWKDGASLIIPLDKLSEEAGATLLTDNGVFGRKDDLEKAVVEFEGHAMALSLLASYLTDLHDGDVSQRDKVHSLLHDPEIPGSAQACRLFESYERDWLSDKPILKEILQLVGLFDRPATSGCIKALRNNPPIKGLTDQLVQLNDDGWRHAIARLRSVRLLAPADKKEPLTLDAHPLVREWFGGKLKRSDESAWRAAHSRLYDYLRRNTREGNTPLLSDLAPLYQAIFHGCQAQRHNDALERIYMKRISRNEEYSWKRLGAASSDLAAIKWFFDKPYEVPSSNIHEVYFPWLFNTTAFLLRSQGRFKEALQVQTKALEIDEDLINILPVTKKYTDAGISAINLSEMHLLLGDVVSAIDTAKLAAHYTTHAAKLHKSEGETQEEKVFIYTSFSNISATLANALHATGCRTEAESNFYIATFKGEVPLDSVYGYQYFDFLLDKGDMPHAKEQVHCMSQFVNDKTCAYQVIAMAELTLSRFNLRHALQNVKTVIRHEVRESISLTLDNAISNLYKEGFLDRIALGHLVRSVFYRTVGDWASAARSHCEVKEVADTPNGALQLILCDLALERARLAFAQIESFAPLADWNDSGLQAPGQVSTTEADRLKGEAKNNLDSAQELIQKCKYHMRDEEFDELQQVFRGQRYFADLPPRC